MGPLYVVDIRRTASERQSESISDCFIAISWPKIVRCGTWMFMRDKFGVYAVVFALWSQQRRRFRENDAFPLLYAIFAFIMGWAVACSLARRWRSILVRVTVLRPCGLYPSIGTMFQMSFL